MSVHHLGVRQATFVHRDQYTTRRQGSWVVQRRYRPLVVSPDVPISMLGGRLSVYRFDPQIPCIGKQPPVPVSAFVSADRAYQRTSTSIGDANRGKTCRITRGSPCFCSCSPPHLQQWPFTALTLPNLRPAGSAASVERYTLPARAVLRACPVGGNRAHVPLSVSGSGVLEERSTRSRGREPCRPIGACRASRSRARGSHSPVFRLWYRWRESSNGSCGYSLAAGAPVTAYASGARAPSRRSVSLSRLTSAGRGRRGRTGCRGPGQRRGRRRARRCRSRALRAWR